MVKASPYIIERVPCALPTLLVESGRLKRPPNMPNPNVRGYRQATAGDANALTWLVAWRRGAADSTGLRRAAASVAFYDRFDWHSSSEVREIVFMTGSARAIRQLIIALRCEERRLVGAVDMSGVESFNGLMARFGNPTRVFLEDRE